MDTSGAVQAQQYYYPYGANRGGTQSDLTDKRYTGQYHEGGLAGAEGLYYYNARWYDPALARFMQADTLVPEPGNPQALNRFAYALNSPISNADPNGHWIESALDIAGIAYDLYEINRDGLNWVNGIALTVDVACLALPVVAGGGLAVRAIAHADDVADVARVANGVDDIGDAVRSAGHLGDATHAALAAANAADAAQALAKVGANSTEGARLVETISGLSTHGKLGAEAVVSLGHTRAAGDLPGYIEWAKRSGATYLEATPEVYETLSASGKWWSVNQQFLDDAIAAGVSRFHLQLPEALAPGSYAREINYLLGKGFQRVHQGGEWWLMRQ